MTKKKRPERRTQQQGSAQELAKVPPLPDPTVCPICQKPFTVIVGCHKICRCGYEEGCGD